MIAQQDKVLLLKNDKGELQGVVIQDPVTHHHLHFKLAEMGTEELVALYDSYSPEVQ